MRCFHHGWWEYELCPACLNLSDCSYCFFLFLCLLFIYLVLVLAAPATCRNAQARDQTCTTAVIQATAGTMPNLLGDQRTPCCLLLMTVFPSLRQLPSHTRKTVLGYTLRRTTPLPLPQSPSLSPSFLPPPIPPAVPLSEVL